MKVPWLKKEEISEKASDLIADYQMVCDAPVKPPIPVENIIEQHLNLRLSFEDLDRIMGLEDVLGATYVEAKRVCINKKLLDKSFEGRLVFTCAHEVGHWVLHRQYAKVQTRTGTKGEVIVCRSEYARAPIEWQADYFAGCLLMPKTELVQAFRKVFGTAALMLYNVKSAIVRSPVCIDPCVENWPQIADLVCETGGFTNVSRHAMIIRLQELGLLMNLTRVPLGWR